MSRAGSRRNGGEGGGGRKGEEGNGVVGFSETSK